MRQISQVSGQSGEFHIATAPAEATEPGAALSTPTLSTPRCPSLDSYDRQLLEFAVAWTPYGGPPDDVTFLEFGTTPAGVDAQFRALVAAHGDRITQLTRADRALVVSAVAALARRQ